ncbi:MAG: hypothetical protein ACLPKB_03150 [Xanthobacteraceae bacterium]
MPNLGERFGHALSRFLDRCFSNSPGLGCAFVFLVVIPVFMVAFFFVMGIGYALVVNLFVAAETQQDFSEWYWKKHAQFQPDQEDYRWCRNDIFSHYIVCPAFRIGIDLAISGWNSIMSHGAGRLVVAWILPAVVLAFITKFAVDKYLEFKSGPP